MCVSAIDLTSLCVCLSVAAKPVGGGCFISVCVCNSLSGCVRYESSRGGLSGLEAPKIFWLRFEDESQHKNSSRALCVCVCVGVKMCFLTPLELLSEIKSVALA